MDSPLRIALLGSCPPRAASGVGRVLDRLGEHLRNAGVAVQRAVSDPSRIPDASVARHRIHAVIHALERFKPHLVHVEVADPVITAAADAARRADVPVTMGFHELHRFAASPGEARRTLMDLVRQTRIADLTIVNNPDQAVLLEARGARRVVCLPRGVDSDRFAPLYRNTFVRGGWGCGPGDVVALWVGRLIPQKNTDWLIAAFHAARERLPHFQAVVVGEGPERQRLQEVLPWVVFTGVLKGEDLSRAYASADCFVYPTPAEAYGNALSEALASGLPVVAVDQAANRDRLRHEGNALLVPPGDRHGFAAALIRLVEDADLRARLAQQATAAVADLSWPVVARRYAEVFIETARRYGDGRRAALGNGTVPASDEPAPLLAQQAVTADAAGRIDEAIICNRQAVRRQPGLVQAWGNLGTQLARRGDLMGAEHCLRRAVALAPDEPALHVNLGMLQLTRGRWNEGWDQLAWRQRLPGHRLQPEWDGSDPAGRRVLLYADGGLGDTVQNLRFVAALDAWGAQVTVAVQPPLAWLCRQLVRCPVVPLSGKLPAFDACYPLGLVPGPLGIRPDTLPECPPPPSPDPVRYRRWAQHLAPDGRLRVGLCWQGNPDAVCDRGRSMPFAALAPLAAIPGIRWFSLQRGAARAAAMDQPWLEDPGDGFDAVDAAFADTCAALPHLDLVITTDTSIAHVAGLMRRPVWLLLQQVPDWRWLLERGDTPWYQDMRLIRQTAADDWAGVVAEVVRDLRTRNA